MTPCTADSESEFSSFCLLPNRVGLRPTIFDPVPTGASRDELLLLQGEIYPQRESQPLTPLYTQRSYYEDRRLGFRNLDAHGAVHRCLGEDFSLGGGTNASGECSCRESCISKPMSKPLIVLCGMRI